MAATRFPSKSSIALALALLAAPALAQHPHPDPREASGTSWQPAAAAHEGLHFSRGAWTGMAHGFVNAVFDRQGGGRGGSQVFSASMLTGSARRHAGPGVLGLRGMLSLDPAMGPRGYRLLLQTGESGDGRSALVDRQHPHDLLMELSASYSVPFGDRSSLFAYGGYPGEPAIGPPVFMHRFSGMEIPEAPIGHHWLDSTHISYGVGTLGLVYGGLKAETSAFRGREPDHRRWDAERPRFDSQAARLSWNPTPEWALQLSRARIASPEKLEPDADVRRWTASASWHKDWGADVLQATMAWGRNDSEGGSSDAGLAEAAWNRALTHTWFTRLERVEKGELFDAGPGAGRGFPVGKLSVGYVYDFPECGGIRFGMGGLASVYSLPSELHAAYGGSPVSYLLWVRAKLA